MFHDRRDRIDRLLLKPLWLQFLVAGVILAFRREFFDAATFAVTGYFGLAWIAGGLFPDRTLNEIAHPDVAPASKMGDSHPVMFTLISRASLRLAFLMATVLSIVGWHAGVRWPVLLGAAAATYFGVCVAALVIVCFPFRQPKPTE